MYIQQEDPYRVKECERSVGCHVGINNHESYNFLLEGGKILDKTSTLQNQANSKDFLKDVDLSFPFLSMMHIPFIKNPWLH